MVINHHHCVAQELGLRGLYRGLASPLATVPALTGLSFGAYAQARSALCGSGGSGEKQLTLQHGVLCGAYTGVVCTSIVAPMELVRCHLQADSRQFMPPIGSQWSGTLRWCGLLCAVHSQKPWDTGTLSRQFRDSIAGDSGLHRLFWGL